MNQAQTEFSICLSPNKSVVDCVNSIRADLPDSPYRDDPPHITLLRGITTKAPLTDGQMLERVKPSMELLPIRANFVRVLNGSNSRYSLSSAADVELPQPVSRYREQLAAELDIEFDIEPVGDAESERTPHMTIRLGVPLPDERIPRVLAELQALGGISFESWFLLVLTATEPTRDFRAVWPD